MLLLLHWSSVWCVEPDSLPAGWGRPAYVPDWRKGDEVDRHASHIFVRDWLPQLQSAEQADKSSTQTGVMEPDALVFPVPYWQSIAPDFVPADGMEFNGPTRMFAARGESEPLAIGVRLRGHSGDVTVAVKAHDIAVGCPVENDVSVRLMLPYTARTRAGKGPSPKAVQAMVLLATPDNTWRFRAEFTMVLVVDFHVPITADGGQCAYQIQVSRDRASIAVLDVDLQTLPFRLLVNDFHAGAFGTTYGRWEGGFSGYTPAMIELDSRFGFNIAGGFFNKGNELPFVRASNGQLRVDNNDARFHAFDRSMRELDRHGMGDLLFWNWGASGDVGQFDDVLRAAGVDANIASVEGKRGFAQVLKAVKDAERAQRWPEIIINPYDEALKDQSAVRALIDAVPFIRAISPDSRLYMTEWRPGYTRLYQSSGAVLNGQGRPRERELRALAKSGEPARLNFAVIGSNIIDANARSLQDELGGEYWHYTGASNVSAASRMAFGFTPWITRAEAVLLWANYKGDLEGRGWTLHFVLAARHRLADKDPPVLAGARAYVVREGIDDRKYIETLRFYARRWNSADDLEFLHSLSHRAKLMIPNAGQLGGVANREVLHVDGAEVEKQRSELRKRILALIARHAAEMNSSN